MFHAIFAYELRRFRRRASTYVCFALAFALGFGCVASVVALLRRRADAGGRPRLFLNGAEVLSDAVAWGSPLLLLLGPMLFGRAVQRDFSSGFHPLVFTTGVSRTAYSCGRFAAALLLGAAISGTAVLGLWLGCSLELGSRNLFGPNEPVYYAWPYLVLLLPNLVFVGALCFAVGTLTLEIAAVYAALLLVLALPIAAGQLSVGLTWTTFAALLDPFGIHAVGLLTRYWLPEEGNTRLVPLTGILLWNRLLWLAISGALLALTAHRFRFEHATVRRRAQAPASRREKKPSLPSAPPRLSHRALPIVLAEAWRAFAHLAFRPSSVLMLAGATALFVVAAYRGTSTEGIPTLPVTWWLLELGQGLIGVLTVLVASVFASELTHRDRDARMHELLDAMPVPDYARVASKWLCLLALSLVWSAVIPLASVGVQAVLGYERYDLGLSLHRVLTLHLPDVFSYALVALAVHSVVPNRYLAHALFAAVVLAPPYLLDVAGLEHNLHRFLGKPEHPYSDLNGYGHFLAPVRWFQSYWAALTALIALGTHLAWPRGVDRHGRARLALARKRLEQRPARWIGGALAAAAATFGVYIFYNTNVLRAYTTDDEVKAWRAEYERRYKGTTSLAQPHIVRVDVAFDLFPDEPRLVARGTYDLVNGTTEPIPRVLVSLAPGVRMASLALDGEATPAASAPELGWMEMTPAGGGLAPGGSAQLSFELELAAQGFANGRPQTTIVQNGSFFREDLLPVIGYREAFELVMDGDRLAQGLSFRAPPALDEHPGAHNYIRSDAHWIDLRTVVSTSADQTAIAPGELLREWQRDGRRYFEYAPSTPVLGFFSVVSGRFRVEKDEHRGVALEIHHHPDHHHNIAHMMRALKDALDYCTSAFGPYPHRVLRVVEFPRYHSIAQAFPSTIAFSESVGFIARVNPHDPNDIDYPYYVTAHEVAHHWWAHQVAPARAPGARLLSESMAEYTALMVMKKSFGPARMQRFLRHVLDRYLKGRKNGPTEVPLARVEHESYLHYEKGGHVLYALADYIGEDVVNDAARALLERYRLRGPPYALASDLLDALRERTPEELRPLIYDFFEAVTSFDNRAKSAKVRRSDDGRYVLELTVEARKLQRWDEGGKQRMLPVDGPVLVDVGVVDERGEAVLLEKRWIRERPATFELVLDAPPQRAGIDPLLKLIDGNPDDNVIEVVEEPPTTRAALAP